MDEKKRLSKESIQYLSLQMKKLFFNI